MRFALVLVAVLAPLPAQDAEAEFETCFESARDAMREITGDTSRRRARATVALAALNRAGSVIGRLSDPRKRKQARFFVGVRRAEVHGLLGDKKKAVEIGRKARARALAEGAYTTYYRAVLLILLSSAMGDHEFLALLGDAKYRDREYLVGDASRAALAKMAKSNYRWYLRLLRAHIQLTSRPAWAVNELRKLGHEFSEQGDEFAGPRDECYSRLAWHFIELRDYDRAEIFLNELPREASRYPRAFVCYQQRDFESAVVELGLRRDDEDREKRVRQLIADSVEPRIVLLLANVLEGLAMEAGSADARGEVDALYKLALICFERARQEPATRAPAYNGTGDCLLAQGKLRAAEVAFGNALVALGNSQDWSAQAERAETLKDQGRLAESRGDPSAALRKFIAALAALEKARNRVPLDALGIAWLEPGLLEAVDGILRLARAGSVAPLQALASVDRMKARGLLDWLASPPSPQRLDTYRDALHALASARTAVDVRKRQLALEALRSAAGERRAVGLDEAQIRELLAAYPDTLFLSYWTGKSVGEPRVYVIAARGPEAIEVFELGAGSAGHEHYRRARAAVRRPRGDPWSVLDAAAGFFVPAPLAALIAASPRVVVSLDADLGGLPVEAFRVDGSPLGVKKPVYRTPSLAVFDRLRRRSRSRGAALIVDTAVPPTGERELHRLSTLEFSAEEGDLVARFRADHVRLREDQATFANLSQHLTRQGRFDLLHISCHAVSHRRIPSASLLMLSDGPLDMGTLATLPLQGMLVVFSSCTSAGAEKAGGEGIKGLLWGPFSARARAVVASHWEMNQQATKDLMGQFHSHLAAGVDAGESMRRARQVLAAAANYAHPSYWAGFGVYATPRRAVVAGGDSSRWLWGVLAGAAVLLVFLGVRRRGRPSGTSVQGSRSS